MHTSLLKSQDLHLDRPKFNSRLYHLAQLCPGLPGSSDGKESACNAGDLGFIPGSGRSPGEGDGNPFQYSCLENSMDRGCDLGQFISLL